MFRKFLFQFEDDGQAVRAQDLLGFHGIGSLVIGDDFNDEFGDELMLEHKEDFDAAIRHLRKNNILFILKKGD